MQNNKKLLITVSALLLMLLSISQPGLTASASNKPVLQPANDYKVFNPTTIGNDGLYIINPNSSYNNVHYKDPRQATGLVSLNYPQINNYGSYTYSSNVNDQQNVGSSYISNPLYTVSSANPFINNTYNIPILASLDNNLSSFYLPDTAPFSLHIDQSVTVFLQQGKTYYGMIDNFGNLLIDFNVKDSSATVTVNFVDSYPSSVIINGRNTVPVIGKGSNRYLISITTNTDTFLTIVPHNLPASQIVTDTLPVNTSDAFSVKQGECFASSGSSINPSANNIMSLNSFSMPLIKDSYYEIFINQQNLDSYSSACSNIHSNIQFFYANKSGTDYQTVNNPNGGNGLTIKALKTGDLNLFMEFIGYIQQDTTVFFRQITAPTTSLVKSLPLNKPTGLIPNIYYTFNTTRPNVFAINYTNSAVQNSLPINIYTLNQQTNQWIQASVPTAFSIYGNLYQSSVSSSIPDVWQYLPAGYYAITSASNEITNLNYKLTVNLLAVNQLNSNQHLDLPVNNNTLVAFELYPQSNAYNFLNLSTVMPDNISLSYNYRVFSKYYLGMSDSASTTAYFGNIFNGTNLIPYNTNNSAIYDFYKYNDLIAPVVILAPHSAYNITNNQYLSAYSTYVNVSLNSYGGNYINKAGYAYSDTILNPSYISSTATALINNDKVSTASQTFIFNLETQPDSLYNVSVYAFGNYSGGLNVSSLSFTASGGKFTDLNSYYKSISGSNLTAMYDSQNILTQTEQTTLRIYVTRTNTGTLQNASLFIQMKNLNIKELTFNQTDLRYIEWNQTHSKYESQQTSTLYKIIKDVPSTSPIDPITVVLALVILPLVKKVSNKRKLRKNN